MKTLLKFLVVPFFLFFGINNSFANITPFSDIGGVSYDGYTFIYNKDGTIDSVDGYEDIKQIAMYDLDNGMTNIGILREINGELKFSRIIFKPGRTHYNQTTAEVLTSSLYATSAVPLCYYSTYKSINRILHWRYDGGLNTSYIDCEGELSDGDIYYNGVLVGGTSSSLTCETKLLNFPYKTSFIYDDTQHTKTFEKIEEDEIYMIEYEVGNNTNTFLIENAEDLTFTNYSELDSNGEVENILFSNIYFNSLDSPLEENVIITLKSDLDYINYVSLINQGITIDEDGFGIDETGAIITNDVYIRNCTQGSSTYWKQYLYPYNSDGYAGLGYGETNCVQLIFDKSYFVTNFLILDWGVKDIQIVESQVCYDPEDDSFITVNDEEITDEDVIEQIKQDGVVDTDGIGYNPNNLKEVLFKSLDDGSIVFGNIQDPSSEILGTCEMFDNSGHFLYYSNGQVYFNFGIEDYSVFDFGIIDLSGITSSVIETAVAPINSVIAIIGIITPFGQSSREYCIFGTVMRYENHKLYQGTEYHNKLNMISYLLIFSLFISLFGAAFGFRNVIYGVEEEKNRFSNSNSNRINNSTEKIRKQKRAERIKDAKDFKNN